MPRANVFRPGRLVPVSNIHTSFTIGNTTRGGASKVSILKGHIIIHAPLALSLTTGASRSFLCVDYRCCRYNSILRSDGGATERRPVSLQIEASSADGRWGRHDQSRAIALALAVSRHCHAPRIWHGKRAGRFINVTKSTRPWPRDCHFVTCQMSNCLGHKSRKRIWRPVVSAHRHRILVSWQRLRPSGTAVPIDGCIGATFTICMVAMACMACTAAATVASGFGALAAMASGTDRS
mmetsp:Transcript_94849/g.164626  ORF Transcript_94849/g.164626 Transcript_94849/m.164626 type:complete len:237 (+) Transcript_94849:299-1009(+)